MWRFLEVDNWLNKQTSNKQMTIIFHSTQFTSTYNDDEETSLLKGGLCPLSREIELNK